MVFTTRFLHGPNGFERELVILGIEQKNHRPHRSLAGRTPAQVYTARAKATPTARDGHWRIRHDKVDKTGRVTLRHGGRLHHTGLGYEHNTTTVRILVHDLHITVINADTGEIIRDLASTPPADYQPLGRPPRRPKGSPQRGGRGKQTPPA